MTISTTEDEDPQRIRELRCTILSYQSPFTWGLPVIDIPIEVYIRNQKEKCEVIEEEHQFQWTRFVPHLILSYEICQKQNNYTEALEHINWCQDHWSTLRSKCEEPLFLSLREVLAHVIHATKAYILLAAGKIDLARKEINLLVNNRIGDVTNLNSTKNKAGLQGLKAAVYMQYRAKEYERALSAAKEARDLDPDQAEWWYIVGSALGRIRKFGNKYGRNNKWTHITSEEIEAVEKAFILQKDASYTVRLAEIYLDYSNDLFFKQEHQKARTYAIKAAMRYREALQIRPNCINLKAQVAHGMMKFRCQESQDFPFAKQLLDEVLSSSQNKAMSYADLGCYYMQFEKDIDKAIENYQKAFESGSQISFIYLSSIKWENGLEDQIISDAENGLTMYQSADVQAMLYTYMGACHALINDDWNSAMLCFQKSLDLDPSARYIERFQDFNRKPVNLLNLIVNHLHFTSSDENTVQSFLAYVAQKKPQNIQLGSKNKFSYWKKDLVKNKVNHLPKSKSSTELTKSVKETETDTQDDSENIKGPLGLILTQMQELVASVNNLAAHQATKEEVKSIANDVVIIKEEVDIVSGKVEDLEPRVSEVEHGLELIKSKVESLEEGAADRLSPEEVTREVQDRIRRMSNIILHNLPENIDDPLEERIADDKKLVLKVSQAMNHDLDTREIKLHRIGKPVRGKFRPLIVNFKTASEAKSFLKNLSIQSVKDFDPALSEIGVSRDRTVLERQYHKSMMNKLK